MKLIKGNSYKTCVLTVLHMYVCTHTGENNSIVNILFMNLEMFLPEDELAAMM